VNRDVSLERFLAVLHGGNSATAQLEHWVGDRVVVEVIDRLVRTASDWERQVLQLSSGLVQVRRVALCSTGGHVLSKATSIVALSRLTIEDQSQLSNTDTSLGVVLAPLEFQRRELSAVYSPTPSTILRVAAVLLAGDLPLAAVEECYTREVLQLGALWTDS
jgi:chorismate-pyruvate lyase